MNLLEECYTSFVNLDTRDDRLASILNELSKHKIKATKTSGIPIAELDDKFADIAPAMWNGTRGALGNYLSQIQIMKIAEELGKHALIFEDDAILCEDFGDRIKYVSMFLKDRDWSLFFCGGTYHADIAQWHNKNHPNLKGCECELNKDFEFTDDERIVRTYGCWGTYAYIVNKNSISKVLKLLDKHLHETIGIDWSFIRVQPQLKCYAFMPGCVKQYDSESNIGSGMTYFSHFERLGGHWFQNKMEDYTPEQFREDISGRGTSIKYRHELIKLLRYYDMPERVVEVGVGRADFSLEILNWNIEKLYLVDMWQHQPEVKGDSSESQQWHDYNYKTTIENIEPYKDKVEILKGYSIEMAKHIPDNSLGLVYIDSNHAYEYVKPDIEAYFPKLVEGGIMAFHDYFSDAYGVKKAVEEFCKDRFEIHIIEDIAPENAGAWFKK